MSCIGCVFQFHISVRGRQAYGTNDFSEYCMDTYRLCVVTNCLINPTIHIFYYSTEKNEWLSEDHRIKIEIQIINLLSTSEASRI